MKIDYGHSICEVKNGIMNEKPLVLFNYIPARANSKSGLLKVQNFQMAETFTVEDKKIAYERKRKYIKKYVKSGRR
jgi:hypothetical protein